MGELWMTQYDSASQEQPSRVEFLKIEFSVCFIPKTNSEHFLAASLKTSLFNFL
jgi:hypothetical protein